jgi:hypothetical protein
MFDDVEKKSGGIPWAVITGLAAFGVLLAVGYVMVS